MIAECPHDLHEREDMVQVDGYCPKCMLDTQEHQTDRIWALEAAMRELIENVSSGDAYLTPALLDKARAALQGNEKQP